MRDNERKISRVLKSKPTIEGAGVHLKRAFGYHEVPQLDPFLLLDDFHSDNPGDYIAGFPWHPHRGIETVTYILHGRVKHEDSIGNSGVIQSGDLQWMTAGSGIIHAEMPQRKERLLQGFQLWINLPAKDKMMNPRYREIKSSQVPELSLKNGTKIRVICGRISGTDGPVRDIVVDSQYLDVTVPAAAIFEHPIKTGYTAFAYVIEGAGYFDNEKKALVNKENLVILNKEGDGIKITAGDSETPLRFLLVSGEPIAEPVAWRGPIVMNTQEELEVAVREFQNGTFIKT